MRDAHSRVYFSYQDVGWQIGYTHTPEYSAIQLIMRKFAKARLTLKNSRRGSKTDYLLISRLCDI